MKATPLRACCSAANAFRPACALRTLFLNPIGSRHASTTRQAENEIPIEYEASFSIEPKSDPPSLVTLGRTASGPKASSTGPTLEHTPSDRQLLAKIAKQKQASVGLEVLEYEGKEVLPRAGTFTHAQHVARPLLPWMGRISDRRYADRHEQLGAEIKAFTEYMQLTSTEQVARQTIIQQTIQAIQTHLPGWHAEAFGSSRTGLALANSDIDIRICPASNQSSKLPPTYAARKAAYLALHQLHRHFRERSSPFMLCSMRHARYPLLAMVHTQSGLNVQIVSSNDTSGQQQRIAGYLEADPSLLPLYALIKTALDIRGLADVYHGGLGSYSLLILLHAFLSREATAFRSPIADKAHPPTSEEQILGVNLLRVLVEIGHLDTYTWGVQADPTRQFHKIKDLTRAHSAKSRLALRMMDPTKPYLLSLQDPDDSTNDLGRQTFSWKHIQATFKGIFGKLAYALSKEEDEQNYLEHMVGAVPRIYGARRLLVERYGRDVQAGPGGAPLLIRTILS